MRTTGRAVLGVLLVAAASASRLPLSNRPKSGLSAFVLAGAGKGLVQQRRGAAGAICPATRDGAGRERTQGDAAALRPRRGVPGVLGACSASMAGTEGSGPRQKDLDLYHKMMACEDPDLKAAISGSLDVLGDAIRLYGPKGCYASFNGGKDAVVILHLFRAALARHGEATGDWEKPRLVYFEHPDEFPEVEAYLKESVATLDLAMTSFECGYAEGLSQLIDAGGGRPLAFVLGTRRGDPNCKEQGSFAPSSGHMPPFMRVNPILDWSYGRVWHFLRTMGLPYCSLYDQGYTSLGKTHNTRPNPALAKGGDEYLPAYALADWGLERAGRGGEELGVVEPQGGPIVAKTAGVVVIGDEVLKGKVDEINAAYAIQTLRGAGVGVCRVSMVSDDLEEIRREVLEQSQKYDVVVTSGGVGPTHDDVTLKAVCSAFGVPLEHNTEMAKRIKALNAAKEGGDQGGGLSEAQRQMCLLPKGALLLDVPGKEGGWPVMRAMNVFVLPGIPQFFRFKIDAIAEHFVVGTVRHFTRQVALRLGEDPLVPTINEIVKKHAKVTIGSYPFLEGEARTVVTFEGGEEDREQVMSAVEDFTAAVGEGEVIWVSESDALPHSMEGVQGKAMSKL